MNQPSIQPRSLSRTTTLLIGLAALVIIVAGLKSAGGIVGPVMLAVALTIVFHPLRRGLQKRMPTWAASAIVLVCAYVLIALLTLALIVSIGRLAVLVPSYTPQINDYVDSVGTWLEDRGVGDKQVQAAIDAIDVGKIVGVATDLLSSMLGILSDLFFIVTLLLFLAFDSAHVSRLAAGARVDHPEMVDALGSFAQGTRSYLSVSAVFGLIVAVVDVVALELMGVPGAFVWGVLAFVTNFIPNIGFVIGVVPPALIALLDGGPGLMIAVIIMYSVVNFLIQSVIQPRFVGNAVGLSTTLTFVSLIFWAWVLGPLGALLAVPMSLFFKAILVEADPGARWMDPLISGRPANEPA
jgi:AI-2 transport protein TqsA